MSWRGEGFRLTWSNVRHSILGLLRTFPDGFGQGFDRLRQGALFVRRVEIEVDPAQRPWAVALAQDDRDLFVERNAMPHVRSPALVSLDGFLHERAKGRAEILRCLVQANDELLVRPDRLGDFLLKSLNGHGGTLGHSWSRLKQNSAW